MVEYICLHPDHNKHLEDTDCKCNLSNAHMWNSTKDPVNLNDIECTKRSNANGCGNKGFVRLYKEKLFVQNKQMIRKEDGSYFIDVESILTPQAHKLNTRELENVYQAHGFDASRLQPPVNIHDIQSIQSSQSMTGDEREQQYLSKKDELLKRLKEKQQSKILENGDMNIGMSSFSVENEHKQQKSNQFIVGRLIKRPMMKKIHKWFVRFLGNILHVDLLTYYDEEFEKEALDLLDEIFGTISTEASPIAQYAVLMISMIGTAYLDKFFNVRTVEQTKSTAKNRKASVEE